MTNGPGIVRSILAPPAARPLTGVGTVVRPSLREIRGQLPGERNDSTFLDPNRAKIAVTRRPEVCLGHTGTPASWNGWQKGKEPIVARLKGEPALHRILDGLGQSEVDDIAAKENAAKQKNPGIKFPQYAHGIASESGRKIEGIDRQISRIQRLTETNEIRAAVKSLADDLPTLKKAADGIAVDLDDSHSPIIKRVAQSIADQLDHLKQQLKDVDIDTVDCDELVEMFDALNWRMETSFSAEGTSDKLTIRTSPLLHESAYLLIDFLNTRGRIIRADAHGDGAVFELSLEHDFLTRESLYTRAEFAAVLRLLGWGLMADQAQTVEVVQDKNGEALKDRSGLISLTQSRKLPAIRVHLDFFAGVGMPENPELA